MGKIKDLTGEVFGRLTVLEMTPERQNRQVVWKCQCDCGNITNVVGQALRTGHTKSCGCLNYEKKDTTSLINQKFGKLIVLKRSEYTFNNRVYWTCKCECGHILDVSSTDLRNGNVNCCNECKEYHYSFNDLTNLRFGLLTVVKSIGRDNSGHIIWECHCDCGGTTNVSSISLVSGNTSSCGCLKNHSVGEAKINRWLIAMEYNFKRQITFCDCKSPKGAYLKYDFGLYNYKDELIGLIEYDGVQHFQPIDYFGGEDAFNYLQICDKIKQDYATNHNIPLLRIKYTDVKNIAHILNKWLGEL